MSCPQPTRKNSGGPLPGPVLSCSTKSARGLVRVRPRFVRVFEREFLRTAAAMLRCRFEVMNGKPVATESWIQYTGKPINAILCYVGYSDFKGELRLLCQEWLEAHPVSQGVCHG